MTIKPDPESARRGISRPLILAIVAVVVVAVGATVWYVLGIEGRSRRQTAETDAIRASMDRAGELAAGHDGEGAWAASLDAQQQRQAAATSGNPNVGNLDADLFGSLRRSGVALVDSRLDRLRTSLKPLDVSDLKPAELATAKQASDDAHKQVAVAIAEVRQTIQNALPTGMSAEDSEADLKPKDADTLALRQRREQLIARHEQAIPGTAAKHRAIADCVRAKVDAEIDSIRKGVRGTLVSLGIAGRIAPDDIKAGDSLIRNATTADADLVRVFDAQVVGFATNVKRAAALMRKSESNSHWGDGTADEAEQQELRKQYPECWKNP